MQAANICWHLLLPSPGALVELGHKTLQIPQLLFKRGKEYLINLNISSYI